MLGAQTPTKEGLFGAMFALELLLLPPSGLVCRRQASLDLRSGAHKTFELGSPEDVMPEGFDSLRAKVAPMACSPVQPLAGQCAHQRPQWSEAPARQPQAEAELSSLPAADGPHT